MLEKINKTGTAVSAPKKQICIKSNTSVAGVFYTVPAGKEFKGLIMSDAYSQPVSINGVMVPNTINVYSGYAPIGPSMNDVILIAGTAVANVSATYVHTILGVEYDA